MGLACFLVFQLALLGPVAKFATCPTNICCLRPTHAFFLRLGMQSPSAATTPTSPASSTPTTSRAVTAPLTFTDLEPGKLLLFCQKEPPILCLTWGLLLPLLDCMVVPSRFFNRH
jgi:hypothetical protein